MSLTNRILLAMVLGISLGILLNLAEQHQLLPEVANLWLRENLTEGFFDVIGSIFIASLKLLVVPLIFVSLVCGCGALRDNARMGAIAIKTLGLYLTTTALAITLALTFAIIISPGEGMNRGDELVYVAKEAPPLKDVLINIFPSNPIKAMAEGNMLQIIVFSLLVGIAISRSGDAGKRIQGFFTDLNEVVMKMVTILIHLAPYGIFCLLTKLFANLGFSAIVDLAKYFATVAMVLVVHGVVVYGLILMLFTRLNPLTLFKNVRPAMLFAFSTSSSGATLPITLNAAEKRIGIDNSVASFTLPLGATINMDGTAIMQGVATVFIAQAFNIDIGLGGYLMVVLTATLASIGTAAVPGVGLITLTLVLQQVGLPVEGIAMIIGVDRLLDMMRTVVNITGDCTVSTVVAKSEGLLDTAIFNEVSDNQGFGSDFNQKAENQQSP